ncbi:radical SAM protein, partial [archaeon]|nr:radical SAM protein [archaeon]
MGLYSPKIISLDNGVAITGEKTLILLNKKEYIKNKSKLLEYTKNSFKNKTISNLQFKVDNNTLSFTVLPTTNCNLRCIYCYSDGGFEKKNLTFKFAKSFIDKLIDNNKTCNHININFAGGGEPLLNFKLIKKIIDYLKSRKFNLTLSMVTNGILVPKYISWLKDNSVFLRISYDGSAQKINRPGLKFNSDLKLIKTFELLKNNYSPELLGIQMTITKFNVNTLALDVFNLITKYNINTIKIE